MVSISPTNNLRIPDPWILQRELFVREMHHQIKNNLQMIASLLNLQSKYLKDDQAIRIFDNTRDLLRSMSLLHEQLYQSQRGHTVDFGLYVKSVADYLIDSYRSRSRHVSVLTHVECVCSEPKQAVCLEVSQAIPAGLIIAELVTNSLKYAFPERQGNGSGAERKGQIRVDVCCGEQSRMKLTVADDGVGFPANMDFRNSRTFGLQFVCLSVDHLQGEIELDSTHGTEFRILFRSAGSCTPRKGR